MAATPEQKRVLIISATTRPQVSPIPVKLLSVSN
jgi:hypothetical protein